MTALFLKGLIIGFAIAAPVGPIGVLCIQRSLQNGFAIGLMTGLGAALADGVYGLIAGFGLTTISAFLIAQQFWIRLIGSIFLLYLGVKLLLKPSPTPSATDITVCSAWYAGTTTFLLTVTNPMTILSFMVVFAGLGLGNSGHDYAHAMLLVIGIILGSALWWLLLSGGVAFILHKRFSTIHLKVINYLSGIIILIFGIYALLM